MKRIVCFFIGHSNKFNNGNPKCFRCNKPFDYNAFMAAHAKKKASVRFRW